MGLSEEGQWAIQVGAGRAAPDSINVYGGTEGIRAMVGCAGDATLVLLAMRRVTPS